MRRTVKGPPRCLMLNMLSHFDIASMGTVGRRAVCNSRRKPPNWRYDARTAFWPIPVIQQIFFFFFRRGGP